MFLSQVFDWTFTRSPGMFPLFSPIVADTKGMIFFSAQVSSAPPSPAPPPPLDEQEALHKFIIFETPPSPVLVRILQLRRSSRVLYIQVRLSVCVD